MNNTALLINNESYTMSESSPEPYGPWSSETDNNLTYAIVVGQNQFYDVLADFPVNVGQHVYLVYVLYSNGDSFGYSTGNIEYIAVFKEKFRAEAAKQMIEKQYEDYKAPDGEQKHHYFSETGKKIPLSDWQPWMGYFESLEDVEIIKLEVV